MGATFNIEFSWHEAEEIHGVECLLNLVASLTLERCNVPNASASLVITDDETVKELNMAHRGLNEVTDVLSFSLGSTPGGASFGEIYISLPQAKRQATALNASLLEELARLLVHGRLHLVGWIHDTPTQLETMERETETILDAVDLSVYS